MSIETAKALLSLCRTIVWYVEDVDGLPHGAKQEMRAAIKAAEAEIDRDEQERAKP